MKQVKLEERFLQAELMHTTQGTEKIRMISIRDALKARKGDSRGGVYSMCLRSLLKEVSLYTRGFSNLLFRILYVFASE